MVITKPAVRAIFKRDMKRWFGNPTGYVFITLFVLLCAAALYWPDQFFQSNLANLDTLNAWFPSLLLFFIPAVSMSIWAGERGQGTDELLLTLPASDWEIVVGKYLAGAGIYTVALLFSLPLVVFLWFLGNPDWGLLFANYLGFWLLGMTLVAAGMIGSQISDNLTVAFIFGAVLCALIVTVEELLGSVFPTWRGWIGYGPVSLFQEMGRGVVSFSSVALFLGTTVSLLYMNLLLLSRRHWKNSGEGVQLGVRFASLVLAAISLAVLGGNAWGGRLRQDLTMEQVHSLSGDTMDLLRALDPARPVYIQAFVSPEVPRDYIQTRRTLLNLLKQYDSRGGDALQVRVVEAERYSDASREAEKNFEIRHQTRYGDEGGRDRAFDMYLGVAFTCGLEKVVIPFLDKGLSVEYELTRSIRTVSAATRKRVGVLDTDVKLFGGMDMQTFRQDPSWEIVAELRLQYDVQRVDPDAAYPDDLDVLLAAMPSSLTQPQLDRLADAVHGGLPTLLIDDPFPAAAPGNSPSDPKGGQRNPFQGGPPPQQKGDIESMLRELDLQWAKTVLVWDRYNPHPQFSSIDPEIVFAGANSPSSMAFNPEESIVSGLQEVLFIFSGHVTESRQDGVIFTSLIKSTALSGDILFSEVFVPNFFGMRQPNPNRVWRRDVNEKTLAARVRGKSRPGATQDFNVIFVPDLDIVSTQFFRFRATGLSGLEFDNVTFALNCIDDLAGDASFIELRKRRPRHRTLVALEEQEQHFDEEWMRRRDEAESRAQEELARAQKNLDDRVDSIRQRSDLDERSKEIQIQSAREQEQRRFDLQKSTIDDQKNQEIDLARAEKLQKENRIRTFYRFWALLLAPIPAILFGFASYFLRLNRETESSVGSRTLGGQ